MKTIRYGNHHDRTGNKRSLVVGDETFQHITKICQGGFGFGGEDKSSFIINVGDWNKALEYINSRIEYGVTVFVEKSTPFTIK